MLILQEKEILFLNHIISERRQQTIARIVSTESFTYIFIYYFCPKVSLITGNLFAVGWLIN